MTVRLRASPFNITIIQVYAPTSSYDDSEVDEFYREFQSLVDQTPKQDILVGTHHNQIDYILVKKRFRSGIKTARTRIFPGADVGSNHSMVTMTLQTRLRIQENQPSQESGLT